MRFLAVAVGTVVGGFMLSTVLVLLLAGAGLFGTGGLAGVMLPVLAYGAGFGLAGWASYRLFGAGKPRVDGPVADPGAASAPVPERAASGKRVTPERVTVMFVGMPPLRHFCTVSAENGVIRSTDTHTLD